MTVTSGEINLQRKLNLICHIGKVKAATSAHSMADVILLFIVFNIPLESNASVRPKQKKYFIKQLKNALSKNNFLPEKSRLSLIFLYYE